MTAFTAELTQSLLQTGGGGEGQGGAHPEWFRALRAFRLLSFIFLKVFSNICLVPFSCFKSVVSRRNHFAVSPSDRQLEPRTGHQRQRTACPPGTAARGASATLHDGHKGGGPRTPRVTGRRRLKLCQSPSLQLTCVRQRLCDCACLGDVWRAHTRQRVSMCHLCECLRVLWFLLMQPRRLSCARHSRRLCM